MTNDDNFGFRFREWQLYKDTRKFRTEIIQLMRTYPNEEKYALTDQTRRALNSMLLNIAEGANKNTDKDTRLYINRAHCSLDEVVACQDCAWDDGYITAEQYKSSLTRASELAKQFRGFTKHLSQQRLS